MVKIQDCPDFITTNFIGTTWLSTYEEDGEDGPLYRPTYEEIALFIDKSGKLYKALVRYTDSGSDIDINYDNPIYFEQVGTDSDWNYAPCTIGRNGKHIAQKGGKIVELNVSNFNITYTDCQQPNENIGTLISDRQQVLIFKNGKFEYDITKL